MKTLTATLVITLAVTGLSGGAQTPAPPFARTMLQDQELSVKDRHAVMSRSEFMPGATSGRHFHPGEEFGYVLEGTLELKVDGKPTQQLKAGDVIFIPTDAIHEAKNIGAGTLKIVSTYVLEKGKPLATAVK